MGVVDQLGLSIPNPKFKRTLDCQSMQKVFTKLLYAKRGRLHSAGSGDMQYNSALLLYSNTLV
jgi:hypothetical protein